MPFELPTQEAKPAYVQGMFDRIAGAYDRVNDLMTGGRHHAWKRTMIELARVRPGAHALDLCTGTGDIARLLALAAGPTGQVTGLDFSEGMLEVARQRPHSGPAITWQQGDALALPFADLSFDAVTVGFGLRNLSDLDRGLAEIRRVLKPGGRFVSLDMGKPRAWVLKRGAEFYEYRIVPAMGGLVSGERDAYEYLPASNRSFPDQRELARRLEAVGFTAAQAHDRMLGAVALVSATAP